MKHSWSMQFIILVILFTEISAMAFIEAEQLTASDIDQMEIANEIALQKDFDFEAIQANYMIKIKEINMQKESMKKELHLLVKNIEANNHSMLNPRLNVKVLYRKNRLYFSIEKLNQVQRRLEFEYAQLIKQRGYL